MYLANYCNSNVSKPNVTRTYGSPQPLIDFLGKLGILMPLNDNSHVLKSFKRTRFLTYEAICKN